MGKLVVQVVVRGDLIKTWSSLLLPGVSPIVRNCTNAALILIGVSCDNLEGKQFHLGICITFSDAISRVNVAAVQGIICFFLDMQARAFLLGITVRFHDRQFSLEI